MDFKSLINKLDSMEAPPTTPKAPELPKVVQLDEDHSLKVLAGTRTLNEAAELMEKKLSKAEKDKKEEVVKSMKDDKADFKKRYGKKGEEVMHATATKIAKKKTESVDDEKKNESVEVSAFKSKFEQMVAEAKKKAKPDFADIDGDGDKKEPMKKAAADKKKVGGKKGSASEKSEEKETKGLSGKQKKLPPGLQKAIAKKKSVKESRDFKKQVVAESVEQKLSFRDMMRLVVESGGQQQIDPVDKALFTWATRVAHNKLGEGMKAEVYAGLVYERMGGRFEMYDVLSEDQK